MKITCQSCQAKYNVADEKVQGKVVKIRCRKCGATIVVDGTGAAANGSAAAPQAPGVGGGPEAGGTEWHVNISDNDQRTMTLGQLVEAYNTGLVTQETFVWTDGMDDWRPLAEAEAVVAALNGAAAQAAYGAPARPSDAPTSAAQVPEEVLALSMRGADVGRAAAAPRVQASEPPTAIADSPLTRGHASDAPTAIGESPFAGGGAAPYAAAAAAFAPAAEPKRAAVAKREARGRDLFATNAGEELQTSAPAVPEMAPAAGGAGGLTGQRNENSVLFSLAVLTQNADTRAPQDQTTANKEDSGLIDLKALAAKADSMKPPPSPEADMFSAPLGGVAAPLGAPLGALGPSADSQPKSKLPLLIGGAAGMLVLLVLGIVIGVKVAGSSTAPVPTASAMATVAPSVPSVEPSATASASAAPTESASAPSKPVAATKPRWGGGGGYHPPARPAGGGGGGAIPSPSPAPKKGGGGDCGCNGDLMCLMKCSTH